MKRKNRKEAGEIMIESTIVMVIVMLMLVWILGVGFIYYQKYTVRIATNDVARKIAATYDATTCDPITAYVSKDDIQKKSIYFSPDVSEVNQLRAESYVNYIMHKANFYGTVDEVHATVNFTEDGLGRSHIKVTTECTFNTPFGEGLEIFGISGDITYKVSSYADSTSITEYVSSVTVADAITNRSIVSGGGFIDNVIGMIDAFMEMCNQLSK